MTPREIAQSYLDRGWVTVPVRHRTKRAIPNDWSNRTLESARESLDVDFPANRPMNVAVLLGEPSGWLVDVDLDCPEAVRLAPRVLPVTATFGHPSNPVSHWIFYSRDAPKAAYSMPGPKGAKLEVICELRSARCATVFPGSIHESGEPVTWTSGTIEITTIESVVLSDAVATIAIACVLVRGGMTDDEALIVAGQRPFKMEHAHATMFRKWTGQREPKTKASPLRSAHSNVDDAVRAFNAAHPGNWPKSGGKCPACGHDGCFGWLGDNPGRWSCFSASHTAPGIAGNGCFHGDALDIEAFAAGVGRVDVLVRDGFLMPRRTSVPGVAISDAPKKYILTDDGNGERIRDRYHEKIRYCGERKMWMHWDGRRFEPDQLNRTFEYAKESARAMIEEAKADLATAEKALEAASGDEQKKAAKELLAAANELYAHAHRSDNAHSLKNALVCASSMPDLAVHIQEFDADPLILNCANGTLDLRTGELRPHDHRDLLSKVVDVAYDAAATCPRFEKFLREIFQGDEDLVSYMQRVIGYSLTGITTEQVWFIFYGEGSNGKSTLVVSVFGILGDYAQQTPTDLLMKKPKTGIPNDVARLKGARFVSAMEAGQGRHLDEELIKQLTGGDAVTARFLYGEFFEYFPQLKLFLGTNHRPDVADGTDSTWRRIRLIPFNAKFKKRQPHHTDADGPFADPALVATLKTEAPGILAWAVRGCIDWQKGGLRCPEAVMAATKEYRAESDVLGPFIEDECICLPDARVTVAKIYEAYVAWCSRSGEKPLSRKSFKQMLIDKKFHAPEKGTGGRVFWQGIGLRPKESGTDGCDDRFGESRSAYGNDDGGAF